VLERARAFLFAPDLTSSTFLQTAALYTAAAIMVSTIPRRHDSAGGNITMVKLEQANRIINAILSRGGELGCRPLSVVVVDPGASVKAFQKEDGSSMIRFEMAYGKAYAALALGRSSSLVRMRAEERPLFMEYVNRASGDRIFAEGGGMLIRDNDGEVLGAVGVTGDTQERDEELAGHGIHAAGLKTDIDCAELGKQVRLKN
jgi:uncharacterized protein GlcG (DUF336 family)